MRKRNMFEVPTGTTVKFQPPICKGACDCCGDDGDDGSGPDQPEDN